MRLEWAQEKIILEASRGHCDVDVKELCEAFKAAGAEVKMPKKNRQHYELSLDNSDPTYLADAPVQNVPTPVIRIASSLVQRHSIS